MTVTTGSVLSPEDQEIEYMNLRFAKETPLRIVTGDKDSEGKDTDAVMIFEPGSIMLFTVRTFVDEKTAARNHGILRASGPIPPQLHKR